MERMGSVWSARRLRGARRGTGRGTGRGGACLSRRQRSLALDRRHHFGRETQRPQLGGTRPGWPWRQRVCRRGDANRRPRCCCRLPAARSRCRHVRPVTVRLGLGFRCLGLRLVRLSLRLLRCHCRLHSTLHRHFLRLRGGVQRFHRRLRLLRCRLPRHLSDPTARLSIDTRRTSSTQDDQTTASLRTQWDHHLRAPAMMMIMMMIMMIISAPPTWKSDLRHRSPPPPPPPRPPSSARSPPSASPPSPAPPPPARPCKTAGSGGTAQPSVMGSPGNARV